MIGNTNIPIENLFIRPNNTFSYSSIYLINNVPQDVTNYKGYMDFRPYPGSPKLYFRASSDNGMIIFGTTNGNYNLLIPASSTVSMGMLFRTAYYDLIFVKADQTITAIMQGKAIIDPQAVTLITSALPTNTNTVQQNT